MAFITLTQTDVEQLLPMHDCIEIIVQAFEDFSKARMHQPLRTLFCPPATTGLMALMPAYRGNPHRVYSLKALCAFPDNPTKGMDSNQGAVMLFDGDSGEIRSIMNASAITAIRTAAVSGVATDLLSRENAHELAILGAGVQARSHVQAMMCVRAFDRLHVWSRTYQHSVAFAAEIAERFSLTVVPTHLAEDAVRNADVIVTATTSRQPILSRSWIAAGAHLNAVGSTDPADRELDTATVASASVFVDERESALEEAGDLVIPIREGAIGPEHIRADLGDVLLGRASGRTSADEVTIFKSVGLAIEDLAVAEYLLRRARATGRGMLVDF
jgi:ornithine cyclodeaminase